MPDELLHDVSLCIDSAALPWEPFNLEGFPSGLKARTLRRLESGTLRSTIVELPAGWSSAAVHTGQSDQEGYVLEGAVAIGATELGAGDYFFHPAASPFGPIESSEGARLLMIFSGPQAYRSVAPGSIPVSEHAIDRLDTNNAPWIESSIKGKFTSIKRKVLRVDPVTGADTRMLVVPAGFEGYGANWHPIHEEIFCLSGDIGPDDRRLMKPGHYLHNPAYGVHGYHEHSVGGATILEWHDGPWSYNLLDPNSPMAKPRD